jgi:DNA-binding PadR family transcriptional regulator
MADYQTKDCPLCAYKQCQSRWSMEPCTTFFECPECGVSFLMHNSIFSYVHPNTQNRDITWFEKHEVQERINARKRCNAIYHFLKANPFYSWQKLYWKFYYDETDKAIPKPPTINVFYLMESYPRTEKEKLNAIMERLVVAYPKGVTFGIEIPRTLLYCEEDDYQAEKEAWLSDLVGKGYLRETINKLPDGTVMPLYQITTDGFSYVEERRTNISDELVRNTNKVSDENLKKLITEATRKFVDKNPEERKYAVEKIWDAMERLKTILDTDKAKGVAIIVKKIGACDKDYMALFDTEFRTLTEIGNKFQIRHFETNKIPIADDRYYDYLFYRCAALVNIACQFLMAS